MIRTLIATMATAAASAVVYRAVQQGKLDGVIDRLTAPFNRAGQPALAHAYEGKNVSRPAPAHPWPTDPRALAGSGGTPDAH